MTTDEARRLRENTEEIILNALRKLSHDTGLDIAAVNVFLIVDSREVDEGSGRLPRRRAEAVRIDLAV